MFNVSVILQASNLPHIMAGKHEQVTLDSEFKADTSRAAECPRVRKPVDYDALVLGNIIGK